MEGVGEAKSGIIGSDFIVKGVPDCNVTVEVRAVRCLAPLEPLGFLE